MVYDGWYFNRTDQGGLHSRCGGWRMNTDRGSIAFNPDSPGTVYVVWCNFPKIMTDLRDEAGNFIDWEWGEFATDTSGLGYSNAEIMLSVSTDYGVHWQEPYNLTETRWEEADAPDVGECMSENWPSVAYVADDTLHIFYVLDREAGGWPQETGTDATEDPMIYHRVALDDLDPDRGLTALPYAGFMFHNYLDYRPYVLDVVREPSIPVTNNAVVVRAECHAGGEQELELVEIQYSLTENVNDFRTAAMENVGGDNYAGAIPAQAEGTRVWYRIHVANDLDFENYAPAATWWWSYVVRDAGGLTIQDIQETNHIVWNMDQSPYLGYVVTTRGVVTTPASFNQQYGAYAIQNGESSDWAGVFVRGIEDNLEEGQLIEVTGMVMERDPDNSDYWGAATYIDVDSYQVLGNQDVPRPLLVTAGELIWSESAEQLEGVLVEIQDFKIWPTIQAALNVNHFRIGDNTSDSLHAVYFTTNGLTLAVIDDGQLRMGEGFFVETSFTYMMGVFGETLGAYAIAPRKAEDVGEKAVDENGAPSPYFFALDKPYPNPFNAAANIGFELSRSGYTSLVLYDVTGREVATLTEGQMSAGRYTYVLNAASLAAGVYIVRLEAGRRVASQKLVLMK
jgi:hypothetical protein